MTEFNRRESSKTVGELYPVLLSKDGQVIDGYHRLEDNPNWKTEILDHIDSDEKLLLARAISNWHRREIPRTEKEEWINGLAKIYLEQGYVLQGRSLENQVINKINEETGLHKDTIRLYLSDEFKQKSRPAPPIQKPKVPASQRIEKTLGTEILDRHEDEVLEKALEDPEFVLKAIEKAPEVLTSKPVPVVDKKGYHLPTIDKTAQEEARQRGVDIAKEREEFRARPEIIEKSRLLKAWRALSVILGSSKDLICPICNGEAEVLLRCKNCGEVPLSEAQRMAKEAVE